MASPSGPKWLDVYDTPYGGGASKLANGVFLGLTAISLVVCLAIAVRTRRCLIFSSVLCVAYILEITAYALRFQPWDFTTWAANFSLSTIAPVFVTIAIHLATASVLTALGPEHALLSPAAHLRLSVWADLAALLLQAVGLGVTFAGARGAGPWGLLLAAAGHTGQTLLSVGLLFQTLTLAGALALLAAVYARAGRADRTYGYAAATTSHRRDYAPLPPRLKISLAVLPLAGACVLVRCAYRTAASWGGIGSAAGRDQVAWLVAEGILLTEALVSLGVFHPALWAGDVGNGRSQAYDVEGLARVDGAPGKRLSSGTTLSMADVSVRTPADHAAAMSPPMFSSELMAPSEAGSSTGSRRGSDSGAKVLEANPYYRFEEDEGASGLRRGPYEAARRDSEDITAETRHLSPDIEEDRLGPLSYDLPRRQPSKQGTVSTQNDDWEVESFVLPPRMPSTRNPARGARDDDDLEDLAQSSTYSSSLQPSRAGTMRGREQEDWEVASFVLPPRMPSKREKTLQERRAEGELGRSDSVSLYSQS